MNPETCVVVQPRADESRTWKMRWLMNRTWKMIDGVGPCPHLPPLLPTPLPNKEIAFYGFQRISNCLGKRGVEVNVEIARAEFHTGCMFLSCACVGFEFESFLLLRIPLCVPMDGNLKNHCTTPSVPQKDNYNALRQHHYFTNNTCNGQATRKYTCSTSHYDTWQISAN